MSNVFEPLWAQYGVDLTLTGHHHSYQRTKPVAKGVIQNPCDDGQNRGTVHAVIGHGGAGFSDIAPNDPETSYFVVADNSYHGYARLEADAHWLNVSSIVGANGSIADFFSLFKASGPRSCLPQYPPPPSPPPRSAHAVVAVVLSVAGVGVLGLAAFGYARYNRASRLARWLGMGEEDGGYGRLPGSASD